MKTIAILSCFTPFLIISCKTDTAPPIPEESFARIYADVLVAAAVPDSSEKETPEVAPRVAKAIEASGFTREEFMAALRWYSADIRRWSQLLEKSAKLLELRVAPPPPR